MFFRLFVHVELSLDSVTVVRNVAVAMDIFTVLRPDISPFQ